MANSTAIVSSSAASHRPANSIADRERALRLPPTPGAIGLASVPVEHREAYSRSYLKERAGLLTKYIAALYQTDGGAAAKTARQQLVALNAKYATPMKCAPSEVRREYTMSAQLGAVRHSERMAVCVPAPSAFSAGMSSAVATGDGTMHYFVNLQEQVGQAKKVKVLLFYRDSDAQAFLAEMRRTPPATQQAADAMAARHHQGDKSRIQR